MTEEELFVIGGILHEARMKECYGNMQISSRKDWPATMKEFREARTLGQPWVDVAVAQAKALEAAKPYIAVSVAQAKGVKLQMASVSTGKPGATYHAVGCDCDFCRHKLLD